jgi:PPOX class probable F420-dependent enzyme
MATIDDVRRIVALDNGLASVTTLRNTGTLQSTVVNAGVVAHPVTGVEVAAFVARGGTHKVAHLRERPVVTLLWRAGWAWATVEGTAELCGPDDPLKGVDSDRLRALLREVFEAAGGTHEDWAEFDRVMAAERRTVVLVEPRRVYQNP